MVFTEVCGTVHTEVVTTEVQTDEGWTRIVHKTELLLVLTLGQRLFLAGRDVYKGLSHSPYRSSDHRGPDVQRPGQDSP